MSKRKIKRNAPGRLADLSANCKPLLPALVAFGSVVSTPALGVELGAAQMQSGLGQPLRASIAFAMNPGESVQDLCIFLRKGSPESGIPAVTNARLSLRNNRILVTGTEPVTEPLIGLNLSVECPGTARLSREYTLFVDPVSRMSAAVNPVAELQPTVKPAQPATAVTAPVASQPAPVRSAPRSAPVQRYGAAIAQGSEYRVQVGDTLSTIAARVEGRPTGVWKTVRQIFAVNPDAFYANDVDRLKAGSLLTIPFLSEQANTRQEEALPTAEPRLAAPVAALSDFEARAEASITEKPEAVAEVAPEVVEEAVAEPAAEAVAEVPDVALSATTPAATETEASPAAAPNTTLAVETANPFVPSTDAVSLGEDSAMSANGGEIRPADTEGNPISWWPMLTGAAVGVFIALGLFGRRILRRFRPGGGAAFHTPGFDPSLTTSGFVPDRRKPKPARAPKLADAAKDSESPEEFKARLESAGSELAMNSANVARHADVIVEDEIPAELVAAELDFNFADIADEEPSNAEITSSATTINEDVDFELLQQDYEAELSATQAMRLADTKAAFDALNSPENQEQRGSVDMDAEAFEAARPAGPNDETVEMRAIVEHEVEIDESLIAEIDTALLAGLEDESEETDVTMQLPADKVPGRRRKKVSNG